MVNLSTNYSNQKLNEQMVEALGLSIKVKNNPFHFLLGDLFLVGARINPKRNFLFVSKLIGKHISVDPKTPLLAGYVLGNLHHKKEKVMQDDNVVLAVNTLKGSTMTSEQFEAIRGDKIHLEESTLFLGFAETATGIGNAVFDAFGKHSEYIHTTRENIIGLESSFNFEEEHSHATSHKCFGPNANYFDKFKEIVLVDDEVTTGNTALNLIRALNAKYPNKKYSVLSILDWRQEEDMKRVEAVKEELGIEIEFTSIISGVAEYNHNEMKFPEEFPKPLNTLNATKVHNHKSQTTIDTISYKVENVAKPFKRKYYEFTGRFGLTSSSKNAIEDDCKSFGERLAAERNHTKTLCLGTGELMHIPYLVASYMGENVMYHSTTRSPIYILQQEGYPVRNAFKFTDSHLEDQITYYMYNIMPNEYEEVFIFTEHEMHPNDKKDITFQLNRLGVKDVHFVALTA